MGLTPRAARTAAAIALPLLPGLAAASTSWWISRVITTPPAQQHQWLKRPAVSVDVTDVSATTITLEGRSSGTPGIWGLHQLPAAVLIGPPMTVSGSGSVTRPYWPLDNSRPTTGPATLATSIWPADPTVFANHMHTTVTRLLVPSDIGPLPAWWLPAATVTGDAAVLVHGRGQRRVEMLRMAALLIHRGVSCLIMSYRGDQGAPPDPSGRLRYGHSEWEDVGAGVTWLRRRGHDRIIVGGNSLGAAMTLMWLRNRMHPDVVGAILDSPPLAWQPTFTHIAQHRRLPRVLVSPTMRLAARTAGMSWDDLDHLVHADAFDVPALLFHGTADKVVPAELSAALASQRPDVFTYHPIEGAGHCQGYNIAPYTYRSAVDRFCDVVMGR